MTQLRKTESRAETIPMVQGATPAGAGAEGRESEAQFRELMSHLGQAFWMENAADTAVLYVSPAFEKIWGRTRESLYDNSQRFLDSVHPADRERVGKAMEQKHENEGYSEEYRILRPDGALRWIWARSYAVRDEEGKIKRYAGIAEDITERKWAEKERSRLAAIIEHTEDAIVSTTLDGVIIAWNHGAERKYGYQAEEIIGRSIFVLIPPERSQEYMDVMKKVRAGEPVPAYDTVRIAKDGTIITLSVGISPIETRDGEIVGISKFTHDISRVRKLEAQLIESQKMEVVGQFTGGLAHDFNNILAIILGYSELMLEDRKVSGEMRNSMTAILHAAERGAALTRQLLVFSRKEVVQPVVLDLNEVLHHMDSMLRQLIHEDIALSVNLGTLVGRIKADPGYVGQVVMNLVINARDAMPSGGKLSITTGQVRLEEKNAAEHPAITPGDYVVLSVSDTGTGMSDQIKARLFEPFFTTKPKNKGTGLGLATCRTIVQQAGGHIGLQSEVGKGTTFRLYFPQVAQALQVATRSSPPGPLPRGTEKLLIVEDDPDLRHLVCVVLRGQGYDLAAAANGEDGVRAVLDNKGPPVRLIISDVIMPHMDAKTMMERLHPELPELKYLFTSGYTEDIIALRGVHDPRVAFLPKPYSVATLTRKVRDLLDGPPANIQSASK